MYTTKTISIWMMLYRNEQCMQEFRLAKEHYERMSDFFNLPIKVCGFLYGNGKKPTFKDDILYMPLNGRNSEDSDKSTMGKIYDFLLSDLPVKTDCYIRLSPSTLLNIMRVNSFIQTHNIENTVLCGEMLRTLVNEPDRTQHTEKYARGNFVCWSEEVRIRMKKILKEKPLDELLSQVCGSNDDHFLGILLFNELKLKHISFGLHSALDRNERISPYNLKNTYCIVCKDYANNNQAYALFFMGFLIKMFEQQYNIVHTPTTNQYNGYWSIEREQINRELVERHCRR